MRTGREFSVISHRRNLILHHGRHPNSISTSSCFYPGNVLLSILPFFFVVIRADVSGRSLHLSLAQHRDTRYTCRLRRHNKLVTRSHILFVHHRDVFNDGLAAKENIPGPMRWPTRHSRILKKETGENEEASYHIAFATVPSGQQSLIT